MNILRAMSSVSFLLASFPFLKALPQHTSYSASLLMITHINSLYLLLNSLPLTEFLEEEHRAKGGII